jgi:hypothetical protein
VWALAVICVFAASPGARAGDGVLTEDQLKALDKIQQGMQEEQERAKKRSAMEMARFKCMKDAYALPFGTAETVVASLHCPYKANHIKVFGAAETQYIFDGPYGVSQAAYLYFDEHGQLIRKELF